MYFILDLVDVSEWRGKGRNSRRSALTPKRVEHEALARDFPSAPPLQEISFEDSRIDSGILYILLEIQFIVRCGRLLLGVKYK